MKRLIFIFILAIFLLPLTMQAAGLESAETLQMKYASGQRVRILVVPGHDNDYYGTSFRGAKEADLNLQLAQTVRSYLAQDHNIEVVLLREDYGYNQQFLDYFAANKDSVMRTVSVQAAKIKKEIAQGEVLIDAQVPHADAAGPMVETLYTLNSWIDSEKFDLVLHVHFNDYGSRNLDKEGKYTGYSVYIPDPKLLNASTSKKFGDAIGKRLKATLYKSDFSHEKEQADEQGAIEDFYLIAMGSYRTVEAPRALVEYSYIYEPQLQPQLALVTGHMLARATVSGIQDFLGKTVTVKNISYGWQQTLSVSKTPSQDVLALQYALSELGFFPAKGLTRVDCPFSGVYGGCTKKAVMAFQASKGLSQTGGVGPATRAALNKIFSSF